MKDFVKQRRPPLFVCLLNEEFAYEGFQGRFELL